MGCTDEGSLGEAPRQDGAAIADPLPVVAPLADHFDRSEEIALQIHPGTVQLKPAGHAAVNRDTGAGDIQVAGKIGVQPGGRRRNLRIAAHRTCETNRSASG